MNWTQHSLLGARRTGRTTLLAGTAALALAACSAQASAGTSTADSSGTSAGGAGVRLNPGSGATSSTPTWSTTVACPAGHQGSAVFREVHGDGTSTNSISAATDHVAAPFSGTLQASIAQIQAAGGIHNGGTQKFVIICFSGPSGTGTMDRAMSMYISYSSDGSRYTTSATPPALPSPAQLAGVLVAGVLAAGVLVAGLLDCRPASTSVPISTARPPPSRLAPRTEW